MTDLGLIPKSRQAETSKGSELGDLLIYNFPKLVRFGPAGKNKPSAIGEHYSHLRYDITLL